MEWKQSNKDMSNLGIHLKILLVLSAQGHRPTGTLHAVNQSTERLKKTGKPKFRNVEAVDINLGVFQKGQRHLSH